MGVAEDMRILLKQLLGSCARMQWYRGRADGFMREDTVVQRQSVACADAERGYSGTESKGSLFWLAANGTAKLRVRMKKGRQRLLVLADSGGKGSLFWLAAEGTAKNANWDEYRTMWGLVGMRALLTNVESRVPCF